MTTPTSVTHLALRQRLTHALHAHVRHTRGGTRSVADRPTHVCPLCSTVLDPQDSNADWFQRCRKCGEVVHPEATEG